MRPPAASVYAASIDGSGNNCPNSERSAASIYANRRRRRAKVFGGRQRFRPSRLARIAPRVAVAAATESGASQRHVEARTTALGVAHSEIAETVGDEATVGKVRGVLAIVCRTFGDVADAVPHHEAAIAAAEDTEDPKGAVSNRVRLAKTHHARDALDDALDAITAGIDDVDDVVDPLVEIRAHATLASVHRVRGEMDAATDAIEYATAAVTDLDAPVMHARVLLERGHVASARHDGGAAREHYADARDHATRVDARLYARRARDALAALET